MVKSRERGYTMWGMIVFIVMTLIFVVLYYQESEKATTLRGKLIKAQAAATKGTADAGATKQRMLDLTDTTGFPDEFEYPDQDKMKAALETYKSELPGLLKLQYDASKYTPTGEGGKPEEVGQGKQIITYLVKADLNGVKTFEGLIPQFKTAAQRMVADVSRAFEMIDKLQGDLATNVTQHEAAIAALQSEIDSLTQQISQAAATATQAEQDLNDRITSLSAQLVQATSVAETQRNEFDAERSSLQNDLNEKIAEVVRLNDRARPYLSEGPDGTVLTSGNGIVVVDLGKSNSLMPGTTFTVLGRRKGGSTFIRGSITVVSCDTDSANCSIKEGAGFLPGDLIQSLTFSPKEQLNFAFVGEFKKMGRGDAMSRMKQLGANVHEQVLTTTHYLVVGTPSPGVESLEETKAYKRAKEYGIKILTEDMLASFTSY